MTDPVRDAASAHPQHEEPGMAIELYAFNTPNGRKISVALEEMELPYRCISWISPKASSMTPLS